MKNKISIAGICALIAIAGCSTQYRIFKTEQKNAIPGNLFNEDLNSLSAQQFAAYPLLKYSSYLPLADFEKKWQLEDFQLFRDNGQKGRAKIFYTDSPTATGLGAMGIFFASTDNYTLVFKPIIQNWHEYNILLCAIFCNQNSQDIAIEIIDQSGKTFTQRHQLKRNWNKLTIDLISAKRRIDTEHIELVKFHFYQVGQTQIYVDDIILAKHLHVLAGQIDGKAGTLFVAKAGKRLRIGVNKRFELVFADGKIVGWYDLTTDKYRLNNLLPPNGLGPDIYQITSDGKFIPLPTGNTLLSVHTSILNINPRHIKIIADIYFGTKISGRKADQTIIYDLNTDGIIRMEICTASGSGLLGIAFSVDAQQGFDSVIGKIRNPKGPSESSIEYCLFRRMGKQQGADMLIAFKPFKKAAGSIKCKLIRQSESNEFSSSCLSAVLISQASTGGCCMHGMLRIWPVNIDNLSNAERYVRKFITGGIEFSNENDSLKKKSSWNPGWQIKLKDKAKP